MIARLILGFAAVGLVPLDLHIVGAGASSRVSGLLDLGSRPQLWCALLLCGALALPAGSGAFVMSLPWFGVTCVIGSSGFVRLFEHRYSLNLAEFARGVAPMFLAVGGAWACIASGGWRPLGFGPAIVLLTAVHFHYAGFAFGVVTGRVRDERRGLLSASAIVAWLLAVPAVAVGIAWSPQLEWLGAVLLACAGVSLAAAQCVAAITLPRPTRDLLLASSGSLLVGMVLGAGYGMSQRFGFAWLTIAQMERVHGVANAFGFAGAGLAGWSLVTTNLQTRVQLRAARPSIDELAAVHRAAATQVVSYPETRASLTPALPSRYFRDRARMPVGGSARGLTDARAALEQWRPHESAGLTLYPAAPEMLVGTTVVMSLRVLMLYVIVADRIVAIIDEPDAFGFAYGTLATHAERGEESFIVRGPSSGELTFEIAAFSRPQSAVSWLLLPLVRRLQRRAVNAFFVGMQHALDDRSSEVSS